MNQKQIETVTRKGGKGAGDLIRAELDHRATLAFAQPEHLTPEQWAAILAEAESTEGLITALRACMGRTRALAAVAYRRGEYEALRLAGQFDPLISDVSELVDWGRSEKSKGFGK